MDVTGLLGRHAMHSVGVKVSGCGDIHLCLVGVHHTVVNNMCMGFEMTSNSAGILC